MTILVTLVGISLLIVLHELGHYAVARLCGMRVLRFSLGFGPTLLQKQVGDTIWQLALVPLGGFVHIHGMGAEEPVGNDGKSYRDKPLWARALVIFAGPVANWVTAALCIAFLAGSVGFTQYDTSIAKLGEITAGGAAEQAGLEHGDQVQSVNGQGVTNWDTLVAEVRKHPGAQVPFVVQRLGQTLTVQVTAEQAEGNTHGVIGVAPYGAVMRYPPSEALVAGIRGAWGLTKQQASLLWGMVRGTGQGELSGLPNIVKAVSAQARRGFGSFIESLSVLSIGLCLLNLLPVPALDGSRLVFLGIEGVRGRPVNQLIEGWVHAVGFLLLFGAWALISLRELL